MSTISFIVLSNWSMFRVSCISLKQSGLECEGKILKKNDVIFDVLFTKIQKCTIDRYIYNIRLCKKKKTETSSYPHNDLHNQKPGSIYTRTRSMLTICYHRFQHTPLREIIYSSSNVHNTTVYYSLTRESNKYVGKLDE